VKAPRRLPFRGRPCTLDEFERRYYNFGLNGATAKAMNSDLDR